MMAGGTRGAVWRGLAASLLLHLSIGAVLIGAISESRSTAVPVVDLTLTGPFEDSPPSGVEGPRAAPLRHGGKPSIASQERNRPSDPPVPGTPSAAIASVGSSEPARESLLPAVRHETTGSSPQSQPSSFGANVDGRPRPVGANPHSESHGGGGAKASGKPSEISDSRHPFGNFAGIRDTIQRGIVYPPNARREGMEGKVVVAFRLLPDGSVRNIRIVQSSGHYPLDQGAMEGVRNASPFPPPPAETEIITPVVFRLNPAP